MEEIVVCHGDEEVEFRGIIVEDSCFGQPDAVGDHLQADTLVIHRHEESQGMLQNLFSIGFHDLNIFIFQRYNHYSEKCHVLPLNVASLCNVGGFYEPNVPLFIL